MSYFNSEKIMVIIKIGTGDQEREVEIVDEKGTWQSGIYHIFESAFLENKSNNPPEPHDINSPNFLGEMSIEKEKGTWAYSGNELNEEEQEEVALFIIDYKAPDGVY